LPLRRVDLRVWRAGLIFLISHFAQETPIKPAKSQRDCRREF
jgi:hypothetical protein